MEFTAIFVMGLLGSLHCIGMCGPIVLALPVSGNNDIIKKILYNLGRIITYSFMGLGAGYLGSRFFIAGLQQDLSIIFGAAIILYVLIPRSIKSKIYQSGYAASLMKPVKKGIGSLFMKKTISSYLLIGMLNGLLPCGFVYMGLAASVTTGSPWNGAIAMMLFGLGTVPALFSFSLLTNLLTPPIRSRIHKFIPALALLLGIIFLLRGLNLGIPYVSPYITSVSCH